MSIDPLATDALAWQTSARRELTMWLMLTVGAVFWWTGSVVDPATNCDESGNCAPWLVPVAKYMGIVFALSAAGRMIVNPNRGIMVDAATGDLVWWRDRTSRSPGDEGRIAPQDISRIRIVRRDEGSNEVHLYNRAGERQPYFDEQVLPWRQERWAGELIRRQPHIQLEIID